MKSTLQRFAFLAVALGLLTFGAACQQQTPQQSEAPTTPVTTPVASPEIEPVVEPVAVEAPVYTIGMSQCNLGEPWRVQMNADVEQAAGAHDNLEVVFKDAQNDTLKQRAHIEEFVSAGVDAIIVSPKEAVPLTPPIAAAYQAGIPVIVLDRRVVGDQYTCFIGADNKLIGEAAGRWIAKQIGDGGKVVELKGLMTSTPGQDRNSGFRKGIEGSGVEVIFEADMKWLEPNARKEMESALARFDEIDLVYGHNDPAAHGAWLAAQAAGRADDIVFVGIDGLPQEGQAYVAQGILQACFEYPTGGREAVAAALTLLGGGKVDKEITLASRVYTPENIADGGEWIGDVAADDAETTPSADATDAATDDDATTRPPIAELVVHGEGTRPAIGPPSRNIEAGTEGE